MAVEFNSSFNVFQLAGRLIERQNMLFSTRDVIAMVYESYKFTKQFEKQMSPREYGMAIQGKRKKKKRGK